VPQTHVSELIGYYDAWKAKGHVQLFDIWSRVPLFVLRDRFERFNEVLLLNTWLEGYDSSFSLLEIGCATGEFYRYFSARYPKAPYVGCDISEAAISRAQEKYPAPGRFVHTDENLNSVGGLKPDVVFCRDVILHQPDPFAFLQKLYSLTQGLLVLRLRTRDVGATETDPEKSCQLNYGIWAPYIVLNCQELVSHIKHFAPPPCRIHLVKHYMVLGGQHARYIPKECYFPETGTAESALLIQKGDGATMCAVHEEAKPEDLQLGFVARVIAWLCRR
jgi:SAM-dependent methyltransferase